MYFVEESFDVVAAFVMGYDTACEGGVLTGFREWLILRLNIGSNLAWSRLVLHAAFPDSEDLQQALAAGSGHRHAIDTLFGLIAEFTAETGAAEGLRKLLVRFDEWERRTRLADD
jgi:hypothetical protein